jgi:hypothetical protein
VKEERNKVSKKTEKKTAQRTRKKQAWKQTMKWLKNRKWKGKQMTGKIHTNK